MNKFKYTWEMFDQDILILTNRIEKGDWMFRNIYGVPRGGLVPAIALSHSLGIPLITKLEEITIGTLIVDEISDTGQTLLNLQKELGFIPTVASLWLGIKTQFYPTFYTRVTNENEWIIMPWETLSSSKKDN